jgi:hypothetical protein
MKGCRCVKIPAGGVSFLSQVEFIISSTPDPGSRWQLLECLSNFIPYVSDRVDIIARFQIERNKAFSKSMKVAMGVNKTGQNRLTTAIDHSCILISEFFEAAISRHILDFTIFDSDQLNI